MSDVPAAPQTRPFIPDEVTIYGVRLNRDPADQPSPVLLPYDKGYVLKLEVLEKEKGKPGLQPVPSDEVAFVVAYGYAFEGHCYRLDVPKMLVVPSSSEAPARGCGFDDLDYRMWRIRKTDTIVEFTMKVDTVESIVLNALLPGNTVPNTYGNAMRLAHRGGRLNRSDGVT